MNPATPSTAVNESEATEKEPWTTPVLKKTDIEETAFNPQGVVTDGDGFS